MSSSETRRPMYVSRRTYLAAVGTGVLTGLAGCSDSIFSDGSESPGDGTNDPWSQPTKLAPDDDGVTDFGQSVALAGDTALVTVELDEDPDGERVGYVFERIDGTWSQQAELTADDADRDDSFLGGEGGSAALTVDTAIVGSERDGDPNGPESGSAYAFGRADGTWSQQAKLAPDDGDSGDFFGKSVALAGDNALVGAPRDEDTNGPESGSAYVFERIDDTWSQQAKLVPDSGDSENLFGWSVALAVDTALVGAFANAGAAYVFERDGATWSQQAELTPDDGDSGDHFGSSVALAGDIALVGAMDDDDPNGKKAGSAYVFGEIDGTWSQQAKLVPDDGDSEDLFGSSVALAGDTALVGARVDEDPNGEQAGSAYVFERDGATWSQQAKLAPDDGNSNDVFGRSVALAGDTALVGSMQAGAYVF